jgi:hypothetical protein
MLRRLPILNSPFVSTVTIVLICVAFLSYFVDAQEKLPSTKGKWYKGNTHAHTLKSDGDSTPEEVAKWYRDNGYHFLFITDHETITPVDELNKTFGKDGEFIVFQGQEVTDRLDGKPYHINGLGVSKVTTPNRGKTVVENLQLNIDGVRSADGMAQINHPNFGWALTAEQIAQVKRVLLLEIYNGHPLVNNFGGGGSPSAEAIWDALLTKGLLFYGVADDDVHTVRDLGNRKAPTPGRGWIMVRASKLALPEILGALTRGDFYSSTGVELEEFHADIRTISIKVKAERWSKYRIQFIGRNGTILRESLEPTATYTIRGKKGYIRVKVIESNGKMAWTQPVMLNWK